MRAPPLDELARRWADLEPMLARATRHSNGCYEPIDVFRHVMAGQLGFWLIEDGPRIQGLAVVEIRQFPRKRALVINFVAGQGLAEWWPLFVDRMDALARQNGCSMITAYGRPGWARFWRRRGIATRIASEIMVRAL